VSTAASAELPAHWSGLRARTRVEELGLDAGGLPCLWWSVSWNVPLAGRLWLSDHRAAAIAAGAVLHYVRTTQRNEALHIDSLRFEEHSTALRSWIR